MVGSAKGRCCDAAAARREPRGGLRDIRVEAHRLAAWRDDFIASGTEGLKANPSQGEDRRVRGLERKVGELTLDNDILRTAARKRGLKIPAEEAAEIAVELHAPLLRVCRILGAPRSTIYARASNVVPIEGAKRGPRTELQDDQLTDLHGHPWWPEG